jgi:hypothetical protein
MNNNVDLFFYSKCEFKSNCDIVSFNEVVLFQHVGNKWFMLDALLYIYAWKHTKGEPLFTKKVMYNEYYNM